jgi:hypothetical protein
MCGEVFDSLNLCNTTVYCLLDKSPPPLTKGISAHSVRLHAKPVLAGKCVGEVLSRPLSFRFVLLQGWHRVFDTERFAFLVVLDFACLGLLVCVCLQCDSDVVFRWHRPRKSNEFVKKRTRVSRLTVCSSKKSAHLQERICISSLLATVYGTSSARFLISRSHAKEGLVLMSKRSFSNIGIWDSHLHWIL